MILDAYLQQLNADIKLVDITLKKSSYVIFKIKLSLIAPALLTNKSILPKLVTAKSISALQLLSKDKSPLNKFTFTLRLSHSY